MRQGEWGSRRAEGSGVCKGRSVGAEGGAEQPIQGQAVRQCREVSEKLVGFDTWGSRGGVGRVDSCAPSTHLQLFELH